MLYALPRARCRSLIAFFVAGFWLASGISVSHAQDPCPKQTPAGQWKTLAKVPKVEGMRRGIPASVWADGKLWVFATETTGAALDVCTGKWTEFPHEKLSPPSKQALGDEPRLDVRAGFGTYDPVLVTPSTKLVRGPGGVEIDPLSHTPRPHFGLDMFAGAKLRVDGGKWIELPKKNAPVPRRKYTYAVARMDQKIAIWGGETEHGPTNAGALFDLESKKWTAMTTEGAPTPRRHPRTVTWTGAKLILWGGRANDGDVLDGAMYDPSSDSWTTMADKNAPDQLGGQHVAVWSGTHLVYFATDQAQKKAAGGVFDPKANTWKKATAPHSLFPTYQIQAWSIGNGGLVFSSQAGPWMGVFDPAKGAWTSLPWKTTGLSARQDATIHWTGHRLIVWGGVQRKMIHPGGGCDGPRPPNVGCDPVAPVFQTTPQLDGASYRPE